MRIAEEVTFGGSGLDRAAHLRGDAGEEARLAADPAARVLPFWRMKPLLAGDALTRLAPDHPALASAAEDALRIFLGLDENGPVFALDLSAWLPEGLDETALGGFLDQSEQRHPALPDDHAFTELRAAMTRLTPRDAELAAMARALFAWHASHGFCARCGAKSDVSSAGWQRQCPACGAPHFPRTDPVVIMLITHGNSVLLGRSPGWPEGMYSLLAGFVEPGETLEAAVRREVYEEAGVEVGRVGYLASQPWPFPASLMIGCRGEALSREITIDPAEIEDALWLPREEALQAMAGLHPRIKPARKGAIAHFLLSNWLADRLD
ncbi:NAD(+) diphosphatase [Acidimangrovimonas sediminis]|uniref:NAD(+) diphosphatase n=1 Tax=Acidimangrovimonas sediminis TaxID=2056283 RepID=UPI000C80EE2B|nr:NAD(+) diphosphatase [Acidimangrovimonas sediminis]